MQDGIPSYKWGVFSKRFPSFSGGFSAHRGSDNGDFISGNVTHEFSVRDVNPQVCISRYIIHSAFHKYQMLPGRNDCHNLLGNFPACVGDLFWVSEFNGVGISIIKTAIIRFGFQGIAVLGFVHLFQIGNQNYMILCLKLEIGILLEKIK